MASRRQGASSVLGHRPKSAASKPLSVSQMVGPSDRKTSTKEEAPTTNIQVAIRCRRRSAKEVEEKSAAVVTIDEASGNEVTVELAATTSTFGVVSLPPTRTYAFDTVFGPDADQATIYQTIVAPMLTEVLQGYNCTLFAYGQTGTGKTYTMQGDLQLTPLGNPVASGGMMPRVLINLFQTLEERAADFSVKISYLELYNEDLRDLLADNSENGDSISESNPQLKIYEDPKKGGVFVQGVEEVPVKSAVHAISQLTKGSHRRQVASTKFNDHSSRSHAIFTIIVHMKERTAIGDDVLRVGKFNLVDLAGSENIGRSGAENKRAREAGMINQSLLTLGRVITALVEKSPHVPYRESKLTRLLQDSLGGKTKTKLIATVSPARCNIEETLSTLEYALSAKSIHNRPEMNQRMSRNALLKDYIAEIERLKADLVSAREKNGMFLSNETWDQLSAEKEKIQLESEEAKRRGDEINSQLNALREEFEQSMAMLVQRDKELEATKLTLESTTTNLRTCKETLATTEKTLQEEVIIGQAYHNSELTLDGVAHNLHKTVVDAVGDLDGLFSKLDRKSNDSEKRIKLIGKEAQTIEAQQQLVASQLSKLLPIHSQYLNDFSGRLIEVIAFGKQFIASHSRKLGDSRQYVDRFLQDMQVHEEKFQVDLQSLQKSMNQSLSQHQRLFNDLSKELSGQSNQTVESIGGIATAGSKIMCDAVVGLSELTKQILLVLAQALDEQEKRRLADIKEQKGLADLEIERLKAQNASLRDLVQQQQQDWSEGRDVLVRQIGELVAQFADRRQQQFSDLASHVQSDNDLARESVVGLITRTQASVTRQSGESQKLRGWLQSKETQCHQGVLAATEQIQTLDAEIGTSITAAQKEYTSKLGETNKRFEGSLKTSKELFESSIEPFRAAKRARLDEGSKFAARLGNNEDELRGLTSKLTEHNATHANALTSSLGHLRSSLDNFNGSASGGLNTISQSASRILEVNAAPEQSTGTTPRKRKWQYTTEWRTAGTRESILKGHHRKRSEKTVSTKTPKKLALRSQTPALDSEAEGTSSQVATPTGSPVKDRRRFAGLKNRSINAVGLGPHKRSPAIRDSPLFSGGK